MYRVLCPRHEEHTPSCVIYPTHAYCYGGCGRIPLGEVGLSPETSPKPRPAEDLTASRSRIDLLPRKLIRGFELPHDSFGFYILFPESLYYKRRNWSGEPKYKNPSGIPQPLFIARRGASPTLFLVEGELNCLSIAEAFPECDAMSPGSATGFMKYTKSTLLTHVTSYSTISVIVDRDTPGVKAAIHVQSLLAGSIPKVNVCLMAKDANEIHCESGPEALRREIESLLNMRREKD